MKNIGVEGPDSSKLSAKGTDLLEMYLGPSRGSLRTNSYKFTYLFIFLVSCMEHLYRKTEKGKYNISSALDSRGTNLEKHLGKEH